MPVIDTKSLSYAIGQLIGSFVSLTILLVLYLIPSLVAAVRRRPNMAAIVALNLLAGWTVAGWWAALIWALAENKADRAARRRKTQSLPAARDPVDWSGRRRSLAAVGWMTAEIVGLTIVVVTLRATFASGATLETDAPTQPPPTIPATIKPVAAPAHLQSSAAKVYVAVDNAAWDALFKAIAAGDTAGQAGLLMTGRVFLADTGSRVSVLTRAFASKEVRVLDGPQAGRSGWVPTEFVAE